MNWRSAAEFFAMGGYAPYVWGAYGLTAALMALEAWLAVRRRRRACAQAARAPRAREPLR
ncbi:MAG: heme exporter protein CcmD [Burkholderiales bacterium]|nr:heme exporter protein CcmD [Burkholderiales bacterium]